MEKENIEAFGWILIRDLFNQDDGLQDFNYVMLTE